MKIVCFGDSITEGCFECYTNKEGKILTNKNKDLAYSKFLNDKFKENFKDIEVINSGYSGNTCIHGLKRIEKDVINYNPYICVVSFGINDCLHMTLFRYVFNMNKIFNILKKNNIKPIFLTENYMCTYISNELKDEVLINMAKSLVQAQKSGRYNIFRLSILFLCKIKHIDICDVYKIWDKLCRSGVDVTKLLINRLNHPNVDYQKVIADNLYDLLIKYIK